MTRILSICLISIATAGVCAGIVLAIYFGIKSRHHTSPVPSPGPSPVPPPVPSPVPSPGPPLPSAIQSMKTLFANNGISNIQELVDIGGLSNQSITPYKGYDLDSYWEALSASLAAGFMLGKSDDENIIIVVGMLGQYMVEAANYSTCDEFNLGQGCSNGPCSCGQRGYNYMGPNYTGTPLCERDNSMQITATTMGGGATAPMECTPNTASAGCCWWGRGPTQLTGQHEYCMFTDWLHQNKLVSEDIDLCKHPELLCTNQKLLWLSGIAYWTTSVQTFAEYPASLTAYTNLVKSGSSNAADQTWINSQNPPSFFSGVGGAINLGHWANGAGSGLDRICSSLKILAKLGKVKLGSTGCTKNPPPPPPYVPGQCGTWDTVCDQCAPLGKTCVQCKTDPSKFQCG